MLELSSYRDLMARCCHCGLCQASCPVYLEDQLQTHVARARVDLIRASLLEGSLPVTERLREVVDRCLLCTSCTRTCAAGVPGDEIVTAARFVLYRKGPSVRRVFLRSFMRRRGLGPLVGAAGALAARLGWRADDVPAPAARAFLARSPKRILPDGKARLRVAYFVGCATNTFYPDTAEAVVKVLARNGVEVILPDGLGCCGMPALADGDLVAAQERIRKNVTLLGREEVDACVTDCTSCGMVFREKALKLLPEDDPVRPLASKIAAGFWEVTDYLEHAGLIAEPSVPAGPYTYHVPCHGGWTPDLKESPRRLLAGVPGAERVEMEYPERCCGAGGSFFASFRELAAGIRSRKVEDIRRTGVKNVITQCPACRSYLSNPLHDCSIMHPMAFLARAYGFP